ncbi:MAG TPA: 1,2-phenylacetyl-CoA epoxidase subunit PaaD [Micromonosporaceae bacterium]|nr:1,2-phenylacetyl-CoA epoxidase subunit PaaD [Micromonosporaceae bacterium]
MGDVRAALAAVLDPEIRVVTIADLGILRDVRLCDGRLTVTVTPTYSGCPAMDVIRAEIRRVARIAGYGDARVVTVLAPPWTTDWITEAGRGKLAAAGIAPPPPAGPPPAASGAPAAPAAPAASGAPGRAVAVTVSVRCPHCGSPSTEQLSRFSSTACKALWRCRECAEPFHAIKAL